MLNELFIENVAVIEKAQVEFAPGLNILTGETGAGKSILIDSINAILGNRTSREIVRTGTDKAVIWATFSDIANDILQPLIEAGYEADSSIVFFRSITADGKSQCRINGKPATATFVREMCSRLINIHGQHDNQDLLNADKHIHVLDNFAGTSLLVGEYVGLFNRLGKIKREIEKLTTDEAEKARRIDLLRYQIDEIDKAELIDGEEEQLTSQRNLIRNSEKVIEALSSAYAMLAGADDEAPAALDIVYESAASLASIAEINKDFEATAGRLDEAYYALREIAEEVNGHLTSFEFDPSELQSIEERLDLIYNLKRKYGDSIPDILAFLDVSRNDLNNIEKSDELIEQLQREHDEALALAQEKAAQLSSARREQFVPFETRIRDELQFLNMPGVVFEIKHEQTPLARNGIDAIEFLISTNPGEPPKPMAKIASGGELSRIMLAIKNALADKDDIGTLIFDEIDTGLSGSAAQRVGQKLKQSAKSRQTICVTHSAPIAAFADRHMRIEKSVRDGRTFTSIDVLDYEQRKIELARIASGGNVTDTALDNAREMLESARVTATEL